MNAIVHRLTERSTDKILNLTLTGKLLISETGKPGKTKSTEKEFATKEEAEKNFIKKEWEALKKGFILYNADAAPGEPVLHTYIGGGYTGSLSFSDTDKGIYIYKNANDKDYLVVIDTLGNVLKEIQLPQQLAWNIETIPGSGSLLMDLDHYVYEYNIEKDLFKNLGSGKSSITSFISVTQNNIAFATDGEISVLNSQNSIIYNQPYNTEIVKGNIPFCAKLSPDGSLLAFHNRVGEIQIIDIAGKKNSQKITADFNMVDQMEFANNNKLLIIREHYGSWGMRYFDLNTNNEILIDELQPKAYTKEVNTFCFNHDQSKMVLVQTCNAYVFDFNEKKFLYSFAIAHTVKTCSVKFINNLLAVRSDYGCFSLYKV